MIKANIIFDIKGSLKVTHATSVCYKANKKKCIRIKIHKKKECDDNTIEYIVMIAGTRRRLLYERDKNNR